MPAKKKTTIAKRKSSTSTKKVGEDLDFTALVDAIRQVHEQSNVLVNRTVNTALTLRNWVIGSYIHYYELNGADRAEYGEGLMDKLAEALEHTHVSACDRIRLYLYVNFARTYPQIGEIVGQTLPGAFLPDPIVRTLSEQSQPVKKVRTLSELSPVAAERAIRESLAPELGAPLPVLISRLSFSHIAELITIEDPLKRAFYEIECIRGNWSVRALRRQIATLYFERSGLSKDKEKLAAMVQKGVETSEPKLAIRDPYIFEFLGLRAKDAVAESDLEAALVENLREFLLELRHGFCLEAQQKSIVIGKTRGFVDLVFYHRILKCHVLVELKIDEFKHEHLGQLNTYVTWYRKHMMSAGDNPPVGLLLCTDKDHALVEYATASVDNQLFVSKYAVELPSKAELEKSLHAKHLEMLGKV